jgi:uncharacterized protein (TIGR02270 family)
MEQQKIIDVPAKPSINKFYVHLYEQYADQAAFLWLLYCNAANQPHYSPADLLELVSRIDANVDALMTAPEESWEICEAAMDLGVGEVFVASVLAFRSLEVTKIQRVVEMGLSDELNHAGLISAMAWLPGRLVHSWIKKFLKSKDLNHKYLALAVCSARREDPAEYLQAILTREDCIKHPLVYPRALRLIGELKRFDLLSLLQQGMASDNSAAIFWSCWSSILMGDRTQAIKLQSFVLQENPFQIDAIEICFRALPVEQARNWVSLLSKNPEQSRLVIKATAILGDPQAVNWLIGQMQIPALMRLAGEAFTWITGIDLVEHKLALESLPDLDKHLPEETNDEDVEMSEDEYLPFPDVNKVAAVWQKYQQRFVVGQRYFMGKQISSDHLNDIYANGKQRQRRAAALELALIHPEQFLLNYSSRGLQE